MGVFAVASEASVMREVAMRLRIVAVVVAMETVRAITVVASVIVRVRVVTGARVLGFFVRNVRLKTALIGLVAHGLLTTIGQDNVILPLGVFLVSLLLMPEFRALEMVIDHITEVVVGRFVSIDFHGVPAESCGVVVVSLLVGVPPLSTKAMAMMRTPCEPISVDAVVFVIVMSCLSVAESPMDSLTF